MDKTSIFTEIEPDIDPADLDPGIYVVACSEKFKPDSVGEHLNRSLPGSMISYLLTGILMPYFLHNLNNLMVGVMGNLDLAGMFMPELEKVEPKISAARSATCSVVDFIRDISELSSRDEGESVTADHMKRVITLITAACGRSVSTVGLEKMLLSNDVPCHNPDRFLNAVKGMGVWCVLCLGGNGLIQGSISRGCISFSWSRPENSGKSHMPGSEIADRVLLVTGDLAASAGYRLVVEEWTSMSGKVTLAYE